MKKEDIETLDKELDEYFSGQGDKTEGRLAFLKNENSGERVNLGEALGRAVQDDEGIRKYADKVKRLY